MNEEYKQNFIEEYKRKIPMYRAYGDYIKERLCERISPEIIKIPVEPRVKEVDSIYAKAFVRKNYSDPEKQITDKIGMRFVVLMEHQIEEVKKAVVSLEDFDKSEDVDYIKIIEKDPLVFDYKSVHYVIRNKNEIMYNGHTIEKDTPCEIQIRTLEQHAYAELSHDYVYKKESGITSHIRRILARCVALCEVTDNLFKEVYQMINEDNIVYTNFIEKLSPFENEFEQNEKMNKALYYEVESLVMKHKIKPEDVVDFINNKSFIISKAKKNTQFNLEFRQKMIFLVYYLVYNHTCEVTECNLDEHMLELIATDLGINIE